MAWTRAACGEPQRGGHPTTAKPPTTTGAVRNGGLPSAVAATSTELAIATPGEEPRADPLRETPEMPPCTSSGHADCTTLTDAVNVGIVLIATFVSEAA